MHEEPSDWSDQWYRDARFGMFVHWGPYAVAGAEASWPIMAPDLSEAMFGTTLRIGESDYRMLPGKFNPVDFDANEWVRIARDAGMRYMVVTAKHHDGFCMFDAPGTDYKITKTPFGRDICRELAEACNRAGMPLGFYYSPPDMHHPGYRDTTRQATRNWTGQPRRPGWADYLDYMESHLRKLLTDYGDVRILWFDGLTNHGKYDPERFHNLICDLSPHTLINDRLGDGYDFITPEQFIPSEGIPVRTGKPPAGIDPGGDGFFRMVQSLYRVPGVRSVIRKQMEKYGNGTLSLTPVVQEPYPDPTRFQPWETCMTMGSTWAYNPDETNWKPAEVLVRNLAKVASGGGNYLLNVGPTARGTFPAEAVERLEAIGEWVRRNGEAIFGTTYTPIRGGEWGCATRKGARIYLHLFDTLPGGRVRVSGFPAGPRGVRLLGGESLDHSLVGGELEVSLPGGARDGAVTVLEVDLDGHAGALEAYSEPVETRKTPARYARSQAIASGLINTVINGVIAWLSFSGRGLVPFAEMAVDALITVAIIGFLVCWLTIGGTRTQLVKGNLILGTGRRGASGTPAAHEPTEQATNGRERAPRSALRPAIAALLPTLLCIAVLGGLIIDGTLYLAAADGALGWVYALVKTAYTGVCGAFASVLAIFLVVRDRKRRL